MIRASCDLLEMWSEGEISYGKMATELSKIVLAHVEDMGMLPPNTRWEDEDEEG